MVNKVGNCKLCLEESNLVDSHIIQRAVYKDPHNRENRITLVYNEQKLRKTTYFQGVFGQFLCDECEKEFNLWDDKGFKLLGWHLLVKMPTRPLITR